MMRACKSRVGDIAAGVDAPCRQVPFRRGHSKQLDRFLVMQRRQPEDGKLVIAARVAVQYDEGGVFIDGGHYVVVCAAAVTTTWTWNRKGTRGRGGNLEFFYIRILFRTGM